MLRPSTTQGRVFRGCGYSLVNSALCAKQAQSWGWKPWPMVTGVGVSLEQVGGESPFWKWLLQPDLGERVSMFWGQEETGHLGLQIR